MVTHPITSLQHPVVKKLVKLREDRSFRHSLNTLLIVGNSVVQEVAKNRPIKTLISLQPLALKADEKLIGSAAVIQKIIGHKTDDLIAAEVELPPPGDLDNCQRLVVLEGLGDPGNVGTIFRTALALGWYGVFVMHGSADPYNDKALRASRGAPLFLPWKEGSWEDLKAWISSRKAQVIVADTKGTELSEMKFSVPVCLILGHETRGPSATALKLGSPVTIPMKHEVESLNVSAAAAILLYTIQKALP